MSEAEVAREICQAVLSGHEVEMVEFHLRPESRGRVLRVTLDRPPGSGADPLSLGEIAEISEQISRALDLEDPIAGRYTLEVSSAGLERPLVQPSDYERFEGRSVNVKLVSPIEGRSVLRGVIQAASGETFVMKVDHALIEVPYSSVSSARLAVDWDAELRSGRGGN